MSGKSRTLKVGVAGLRGIVGESLTPSLAASFAAAFGRYLGGNNRVVIGRDTRPSGMMLEHAVIAGLLSVGCQPVLLGVVPTPTVQILVDEYKASGGIAITASHNPVQWNALKFIGPSGIFLDRNETAELLDIYNQTDLEFVTESDYRNIRRFPDAFAVHRERVFANVDVEAIRARKFRVAVDCCNGVGAVYTRDFLKMLGCEVFSIYDEPSGIFERPAEPMAENLSALGEAVRNNNCVLGFAHDPDGDRLGVVDGQGGPVGEQNTLLLAIDHVLAESPGDVAVNVQTSRAVQDIAESYGCQVEYSPVGEINVIEKMFETGAMIGGEGNCGGLIWRRIHPCRDSYTLMALILEMLALTSQSFEEVVASLPQYFSRAAKYNCPAVLARDIVRALTREYAEYEPNLLDGLRLDIGGSMVLIRASNTEPVLRLFVEAATEREAAERFAEFEVKIKKYLQRD